jgi:hypothetical protein
MNDMALPEQVQRTAERVAKLEADITGTPAVIPPDTVAVVEVPQPVEQVVQPIVQAPAPDPERQDWKSKYLVLNGKYVAEVPRLNAELRDLRNQLHSAATELTALKSKPAPVGNTDPAEDDDIDPALRAMIERSVRGQIAKENAPLVEQTKHLQEQNNRSAWDHFVGSVAAEISDYQSIDASDEFQVWAADLDLMSGKSRGELLQDAVQAHSSARVIAIYRQYKSEVQASTPPPKSNATVVVPTPLEDKTVPLPSSSAATPIPGRVFTRAEVADFYTKVTKGEYRGNPDEATRIEAEITSAYREGRVQ